MWLRLTRVSPPLLAVGSLLVAAAGLGLAHVPALAPAAYTLTAWPWDRCSAPCWPG